MCFNIKNAETCRLADELARLTGETTTDAVREHSVETKETT